MRFCLAPGRYGSFHAEESTQAEEDLVSNKHEKPLEICAMLGLTCRLGTQVGLSPRFNLSISSALSDILFSSSPFVVDECIGLSGTGPSQSSVRRLSSDKRRLLEGAGSIAIGLEAGDS